MTQVTKTLTIVRGLPGSGKTTFAEAMAPAYHYVFSADDFFSDSMTGEYKFDASKLGMAHASCRTRTELALIAGDSPLFVANTFTTEKEMEPYIALAKKYGYMLFSVIVENRSQTQNIHGVPADTLKKMADRFHIQL